MSICTPFSLKIFFKLKLMSCPPWSTQKTACLRARPSNMGTVHVWPAPHSTASPLVRPEAKMDKVELLPMQMEGEWYVSNSSSAHLALSAAVVLLDSTRKTDVTSEVFQLSLPSELRCVRFTVSAIVFHSVSISSQSWMAPLYMGCEACVLTYCEATSFAPSVGNASTDSKLLPTAPLANVEGNTKDGTSSPLHPAFTADEPISTTKIDSSAISLWSTRFTKEDHRLPQSPHESAIGLH
mmetsp:Transcript_14914/g.32934  ORF Transcript_14914/g.32934 Transcript_14914/m.32934 type:complete len:239 (-) Transcript_14914:8-724(-)